MSLDAFWKQLRDSGWEAAVPAAELTRIKAQLSGVQQPPDSAYEALAGVVFDTECIESSGFEDPVELNSYAKLIEHFAEASHGAFRPTAIVDAWDTDTGTARVGFDCAGRHYEVTVELQSDWFQGEVFELINHALEEDGRLERFVALPVVDQVLHAAFVDPTIVERAREIGLIPDMSTLLEGELGISAEAVQALGDGGVELDSQAHLEALMQEQLEALGADLQAQIRAALEGGGAGEL